MEAQAFRFMDLPLEVRLMIYERLPRQIIKRPIQLRTTDNSPYGSKDIVLFTKAIPTSVLLVSRKIYHEASPAVAKHLQEFMLGSDHVARMFCVGKENLCQVLSLRMRIYKFYWDFCDYFQDYTTTARVENHTAVLRLLQHSWSTIASNAKLNFCSVESERNAQRFIFQLMLALLYNEPRAFRMQAVEFDRSSTELHKDYANSMKECAYLSDQFRKLFQRQMVGASRSGGNDVWQMCH